MPPEVTQVTHKHVYDGPITRSRAKLLQKDVNSLLSETNFNIFEDVILPKYSTLILLRHVHKEDWNIKQSGNQFTSTSSDQSEPVRTARSEQPDRTSQFGPPVRTTKRKTHNSWFPKDLKAHEYSLESLWSILSNPTSVTSFRLPNQDLWSNHWRLLRMSRVCPRIYLAQLPMQDCTILHCFMAHATHAWKAYQV